LTSRVEPSLGTVKKARLHRLRTVPFRSGDRTLDRPVPVRSSDTSPTVPGGSRRCRRRKKQVIGPRWSLSIRAVSRVISKKGPFSPDPDRTRTVRSSDTCPTARGGWRRPRGRETVPPSESSHGRRPGWLERFTHELRTVPEEQTSPTSLRKGGEEFQGDGCNGPTSGLQSSPRRVRPLRSHTAWGGSPCSSTARGSPATPGSTSRSVCVRTGESPRRNRRWIRGPPSSCPTSEGGGKPSSGP
jgi:hypothetical protein